MIAREWKTRCPADKKLAFIEYLYQTGVKDAAATTGFIGAHIFEREFESRVEITLITYWQSTDDIKNFAGDNIESARLYPEDHQYQIEADDFVIHYQVAKVYTGQ